jgi:formate C-acetyltransferase
MNEALTVHTEPEEQTFLTGLRRVAETLIRWAEKCAERVSDRMKALDDPEVIRRFDRLSCALRRVPAYPPVSFYEAILTIYICFSADPDSFGTLDRTLYPFYEKDIREGTLTRGEAKAFLQELFLMVQAATAPSSSAFTRGGESHFCVGGYLPDGTDGFSDLSRLILEALTELPTYIPQVTLRWTPLMSHDDFRYTMDLERKDPHKRIAFTNDEKRVQCYTCFCGFPFERAVNYTMVGCNEPAFLGAITGSNSKGNILRCIETLFHKKADQLANCTDFEAFYATFEQELFNDLDLIYRYDDCYNAIRARDVNYISSLFFNDCIENARSLTQGGGNTVISSPMLLGIPNVIDSLTVIRQFIYEEKLFSMKELTDALAGDWEGYEEMRTVILRRGLFFGNDDTLSDEVSARLYDSFFRYLDNGGNRRKNLFGYPILIGDLLGYNEHHKWFGEKTLATPDGRRNGDLLKFGLGQSGGKDRNGLTALLRSIAQSDPHGVGCGATVTNISLEEKMVTDDEQFEKTVVLFETYFKLGGTHFQLTYVSREDLLAAQKMPENYQNLRVRITGFSDYFVNLQKSVQDDIIQRTPHGKE